jgi:hypothetical protein
VLLADDVSFVARLAKPVGRGVVTEGLPRVASSRKHGG